MNEKDVEKKIRKVADLALELGFEHVAVAVALDDEDGLAVAHITNGDMVKVGFSIQGIVEHPAVLLGMQQALEVEKQRLVESFESWSGCGASLVDSPGGNA